MNHKLILTRGIALIMVMLVVTGCATPQAAPCPTSYHHNPAQPAHHNPAQPLQRRHCQRQMLGDGDTREAFR